MWESEIRRNSGEELGSAMRDIRGIVGQSKSWRDSGTREGMNESGKKGVWHGRE